MPDLLVAPSTKAIAAAQSTWAAFSARLADNAAAPADFEFEASDDEVDSNIPYENLHPLQRRQIDVNRAQTQR